MGKKLGWLGPAIVIVGLLVGGAGVWYMVIAKPAPGDVIDEIPIDGTSKFVGSKTNARRVPQGSHARG